MNGATKSSALFVVLEEVLNVSIFEHNVGICCFQNKSEMLIRVLQPHIDLCGVFAVNMATHKFPGPPSGPFFTLDIVEVIWNKTVRGD